MIFVGDVAIAPGDKFNFNELPPVFAEKKTCINLEGAISSQETLPNYGVINTPSFFDSFEYFNLAPVFLANNHILDVDNGIDSTLKELSHLNVSAFGVQSESTNLVQKECDEFILLGYGWSVIGCQKPIKNKLGVAQLDRAKILDDVTDALRNNPDKKIIAIFHWNYEFELYPQPGHRKLAHELIDMGCTAVIGHHPHIVGPIELYKGKVIAYSLGNWAFSYGKFFDGKLKFPASSFSQIALELCGVSARIHWFNFVPPLDINFVKTEEIINSNCSLLAEFSDMNDDEYVLWFKEKRKKNFLLPIYLTADSSIENKLKNIWVSIRQILIDYAVKLNIKSLRRNG